MKPNSTPPSPSYRDVTHRGAQAQAANDARMATTVGHLNRLHGRAGNCNENLKQEEEVPGWLEDAFEVWAQRKGLSVNHSQPRRRDGPGRSGGRPPI